MAYDDDLANRVRELFAEFCGRDDVSITASSITEKAMFGGLGFMVNGHMAIAVSREGGILGRCDPDDTESILSRTHTAPMVMRGRDLAGWFRVDADGVGTKRQLRGWMELCSRYVAQLPPKH
ncbi:TfoX/Sxy family protein [Gordonia effusa]|nr:TfoX/Sxy family protein [Gordonia effusa]